MTQFPKIEENQISLSDLQSLVKDWRIMQKIRQKISTWGIKHSSKTMNMSLPFLEVSFVYYALKSYPQTIRNYEMDSLNRVEHSLRHLYNQCCIDFFKKEENFQYTLVVLAKVMAYFLVNYFLNRKIGLKELEKDIYMTIVNLLIGYEVDSNAYQILQHKFKATNIKTSRKKTIKISSSSVSKHQIIELKSNNSIPQIKYQKKSLQNVYKEEESESKRMAHFKLQVSNALKIKSIVSVKLPRTIKSQKHSSEKQNSQQYMKRWVKGKVRGKILNVNQVSAAMSINPGLDLSVKAITQIHLSKRKNIHNIGFQKEDSLSAEGPSCPINQEQLSSTNKNWSSIIDEIKRTHYQSCHLNTNFERDSHYFSFFRQQTSDMLRQAQIQRSKDIKQEEPQVEFKKMNKRFDTTISCKMNEILDENIGNTSKCISPKKSNSIWLMKSKQQFINNCSSRKQKFIEENFLPKIDKS